MAAHPAVGSMIARYRAGELHASRSGRETIEVLLEVCRDSRAADVAELAADVARAVGLLLDAMPPYAPPVNAMHLFLAELERSIAAGSPAPEVKRSLENAAERFRDWSGATRLRTSQHAATLIEDGRVVFTFTLSETVMSVFRQAAAERKRFRVIVTESQPNCDGLATAETLAALGVPVSVGIDAGVGELVPQADLVLVGAEAIEADGSAVCKVGTYPAASVAARLSIPVFVVADTMKFDVSSTFGLPLPAGEIDVSIATGGRHAASHMFDRTPSWMVRGIVTERGVLPPDMSWLVVKGMPCSRMLQEKLASHM